MLLKDLTKLSCSNLRDTRPTRTLATDPQPHDLPLRAPHSTLPYAGLSTGWHGSTRTATNRTKMTRRMNLTLARTRGRWPRRRSALTPTDAFHPRATDSTASINTTSVSSVERAQWVATVSVKTRHPRRRSARMKR